MTTTAPARVSARPRLGYGLALAAAVCFVLNAGVSRAAIRGGVDPTVLTTVRVTGSLLVLVAAALLLDRAALRVPRGRVLGRYVALGVVGVAGVQWTYNVAIDRLPVGIALLLEYLAPVLVVLWVRVVRHEPVRRLMWVAVGATLVGLGLVSQAGQGVELDGLGVLAGLGAALCFAAYFLIGEHGVGHEPPLRVALWSFAFATLAMNVVRPFWRLPDLRVDASLTGTLAGTTAPLWLLLAWVVLLGTVLPFSLELLALQHLPATVVTVVATLEPVGAAVLGWVWFRESLTPVQVVGGLVVVAGIVLAQAARRAPPPVPLP